MADAFDRFLAASLAPAERLPDRRFVASVQARIMLEGRLESERRALMASLAAQLVALLAVAAAVWILGHAVPVGKWFAQSSALGLVVLLLAFGFVVAMFISAGRPTLRSLELG